VGIPILGRVAAGRPLLADENIEGYVQPESFFGVTRDEKFFCLRVRGDSMKDVGIMEGDLLVVRPTRKPGEGDITVVVVGEEATVKIVRMPPGGAGESRLVLEPANDAYESLDVTGREDVRIAGRVMASYREY